MSELPELDVWVTAECSACARTLRTLEACESLQGLVAIRVRDLSQQGQRPPGVVGGPTITLGGEVVALGTPDCSELTERVISILSGARQPGVWP
ncbi:hypothetical protein [Tepidiforma sp.]|uniref:hypothetical protein n=1 Tax=Tepidiforma sp. TaxID=2682230 RepID=UPI002ADE8135|nr:hypothetical protein [Tepidiforma sp.]